MPNSGYRGRLAPSPTGYLHLGHARTFWMAQERARARGGQLILRNEDLDGARCKPEFATAMLEDLRWIGLEWQEGPDIGGPVGPYSQSERLPLYRTALEELRKSGHLYRCTCSRKDIQQAASAPHPGDDEPVYPGTCRATEPRGLRTEDRGPKTEDRGRRAEDGRRKKEDRAEGVGTEGEVVAMGSRARFSWRFRVPDGEAITFHDGAAGEQMFVAGQDFGDFVVWRHDDVPSYQLTVVVDDAAMGITEVVRGADLLVSTARQLLLYRALQRRSPAFFHCPLMADEKGVRLAKRHDALSLRTLRERGARPEELRANWKFVQPFA